MSKTREQPASVGPAHTTFVRCFNRMLFEVDPETLEPLSCSFYEPYCYSDPNPQVRYIEHADWCAKRNGAKP